MDQWVKDKLAEWGLEKWEGVFEDEEVDSTAFRCLSEEVIKKIIPKAGPQSKFLYFWKSQFGTIQSDIDSATSILFEPPTHSSTRSVSSRDLTPIVALSEVSEDNDYTLSVDVKPVLPPLQGPGPSSNAHNSLFPIDSSDITVHPSAPINDLIDTLRNTAEGVAILTYYKAHRDLTDEHRYFLVEIILYEELRSARNFALTPERLEQLSRLIKLTFPTEDIYIYYVPYRVDTVTKKKMCAKGKLYDRYNTHRSFLLLSKATESLRGTKRKSVDASTPVRLAFRRHFTTDECSADYCKEKVEWLKNSIEPWSTVEKYWVVTSKERIKKLYESKDLSRETYIANYPALKNPARGMTLIELDFATLYPNKVNALYTEYPALEKEIVNFCKTKKRRLDSEVKNLLQKIEENNSDCNSSDRQPPDSSCAAVLRLLPLLLPPPSASKVHETSRRPNKSEVQDEFLLHVKTMKELQSKLNVRRQKISDQSRSEHPLAVVVGTSLEDLTHFYVCVNDIKYEVSSVLQATDVAFKSFYSLQLDYPPDALLPWMVIQHRVYGVQGESDKILPCVSKFLGELRQTTR